MTNEDLTRRFTQALKFLQTYQKDNPNNTCVAPALLGFMPWLFYEKNQETTVPHATALEIEKLARSCGYVETENICIAGRHWKVRQDGGAAHIILEPLEDVYPHRHLTLGHINDLYETVGRFIVMRQDRGEDDGGVA